MASNLDIISSDTNYQAFTPVIKIDGNKPVREEIASFSTDVDMFQGWLPLTENLDEVLNSECGGNITVYDRIGRDPRVASNLRTRAKAVVGREWDLTPYSQEKIDIEVAEYVKKVFLGFPYDRARRSLLRGGVLKGYSIGEVMWDYSEGDTFISDIRYRHQRRFRFTPAGELHLLTLSNPYPGISAEIDPTSVLLIKKFQRFTFGDEIISPYGNGLGQELYWPWWFKRNGIKYWLVFVEKFAAPTAAGEYPAGTDQGKQQELLSAAASLHSNSAIVYPQGMNLRLIEAARTGSITCYKELCDFMNDEMTICILGQLATTSGQPGKLGNSQEQEAVYLDYIKDDADSLCEAQNDHKNGVIPWLVDYQFPGLNRYPKIWIKTEDEEDGKTLAERDQALAAAMKNGGKYRLGRSYWVRNYGLDKEDLEEMSPAEAGEKTEQPKKPIEFAESGDETFPDQELLDKFVQGITTPAELQKLMEGVLKPVFKLVEEGGDLQELYDDLPKLFPKMDADQIEEILGRAFFVASVWGRLSAEEEMK